MNMMILRDKMQKEFKERIRQILSDHFGSVAGDEDINECLNDIWELVW